MRTVVNLLAIGFVCVVVVVAVFLVTPFRTGTVGPAPTISPESSSLDESASESDSDLLGAEAAAMREESRQLRDEAAALRAELRETLEFLREAAANEDGKGEESANLDRPDTAEERRVLAIARRYMNDVAYLEPSGLTSGERAMLGSYAERLRMVRRGDRIGLFGVFGEGKDVRDVSEPLDEWVDAYAAVSTHYQVESERVISDLVARGQVDEFDDKIAASTFETQARATYRDQYGEEHPGFEYRWVEGSDRVQLVDRDRLLADAVVAELDQLRTDIGARLGEGEEDAGVMEKWVPAVPEAEDRE